MDGYTSWNPQYVPKQSNILEIDGKGILQQNNTVVGVALFREIRSGRYGYNVPKGPGTPITADPSTGKTEIGLYYNKGVRSSETQVSLTETASIDAVDDGPPQTNTEPFTRASTFGATPNTTLGGAAAPTGGGGGSGGGSGGGDGGVATSTAGAGEL